ncbi:MAG: hypothetical protein ACTHNP_10075 [Solirubrobacterales bacterium]
MKCLKMFTLAALAAVALMALVGIGTASATTLDGSGGAMLSVGAEIDLSAKGSVAVETTEGSVIATCANSTIEARTTNTGSDLGEPVTSNTEVWTWGECSATVDTVKRGTLSFKATSGGNGTVVSAGAEVTVQDGLAGSCTYGAGAGVTLGTLTGGSPGLLSENAALTRTGGSLLCAETIRITGSFTVTAPTTLVVTGP